MSNPFCSLTFGACCSLFVAVALLPSTPAAQAVKTNLTPIACNLHALTPASRRRLTDLGPVIVAKVSALHEIPDGYEFVFTHADADYPVAAEWANYERLCCPFFDIELREEREHGRLSVRLRGREGVKEFIRAEFAPVFAKFG